jgi:hypothetical protein
MTVSLAYLSLHVDLLLLLCHQLRDTLILISNKMSIQWAVLICIRDDRSRYLAILIYFKIPGYIVSCFKKGSRLQRNSVYISKFISKTLYIHFHFKRSLLFLLPWNTKNISKICLNYIICWLAVILIFHFCTILKHCKDIFKII